MVIVFSVINLILLLARPEDKPCLCGYIKILNRVSAPYKVSVKDAYSVIVFAYLRGIPVSLTAGNLAYPPALLDFFLAYDVRYRFIVKLRKLEQELTRQVYADDVDILRIADIVQAVQVSDQLG
jgi:hypothetical protein